MALDQCLWWGFPSTMFEQLPLWPVTKVFRAWWASKLLHPDHKRCPPPFPSTFTWYLCSPGGRAAHTITLTTTLARKGVCLYLLKWLSTMSLWQGQRTGKKIPQRNMKTHLRNALGNSGNKHLVVLILFCLGWEWQNWMICSQRP